MKTVVEHGGQILGHAAHAAGTYGFDSGLFDCFEHGARLLAARRQLPMHCRVVAGKPQRDRIGVTACASPKFLTCGGTALINR